MSTLAFALPRGVFVAEWIKLRSVRSTYIVLGVAVGLGLGLGMVDLFSIAHNWDTMNAADKASFDPVGDSFGGFQLGELAFGALGVLVVGSEYGTGLIRTTFTAVPRRGVVFAVKALVLGGFALVFSELCAFTAFFIGQAILSGKHLNVGISDHAVLRSVTCAGLYMAVVTMVGFGLGALLRHTAGALAAMFALVFLSYPAARAVEGFSPLPDRWLLINAAGTLVSTHPATGPHTTRVPSLGLAYLDLAAYLLIFLGLGYWRMTRDA